MYPIDLLKVRILKPQLHSDLSNDECLPDQDASRQPFPYRSIHGHIQCYGHNIKSGGLQNALEGLV